MSGFPIDRQAVKRRMKRKKGKARGGFLDLFLVAVVVVAVWVRTPAGALGEWAVSSARGDVGTPDLVARFAQDAPVEVLTQVRATLARSATLPTDEGAFPEPFRSAARTSLGDEQLARLDELHQGDPEASLEILAIGPELRERAIQRATMAGDAQPHTYAAHRRYLPRKARKRADEVVTGTLGIAAMLSLEWPVAGEHRISSPYGYRNHPTLKRKKFHNGVDLAIPVGTPILSAQGGTVAVASEDRVNGKYVVIDHGYGVKTSYCHLSELGVEAGDELRRGEEIALSGNTGRSTGPHLHFVLRVGKDTVDPERFRPLEPGEQPDAVKKLEEVKVEAPKNEVPADEPPKNEVPADEVPTREIPADEVPKAEGLAPADPEFDPRLPAPGAG